MTAKTIETGQLCGVISSILPDGKFIKCEPIFVDYWNSENPSAYYRGIKPSHLRRSPKTGISHFEEIDINMYDKISLPSSPNKINDGKKYFIPFHPSQNCTKSVLRNAYSYRNFPIIIARPDNYFSQILNVGILFPDKFVAVISKRELPEEALLFAIEHS